MRLSRVACSGVAGVPDGDYSFSPEGAGEPFDFVLVTGPPASGKTRLLEAILAAREVISPSGADIDPDTFIAHGGETARMELVWVFEDEPGAVRFHDGVLEAEVLFGQAPEPPGVLSFELAVYEHGPDTPKIEYFHAHRRIVVEPSVGLDPEIQKPLRASRNARKYAFIPTLLRRLGSGGDHASFTTRLATLGASCTFAPESAARGGAPFRDRRGDPLRLADLSSGDEDAVIFAATATLLGLDRSILLVDRPEMFLPLDAAALPAAIASLGQGAQVIAASASPRLCAAVPPAQIVVLPDQWAS